MSDRNVRVLLYLYLRHLPDVNFKLPLTIAMKLPERMEDSRKAFESRTTTKKAEARAPALTVASVQLLTQPERCLDVGPEHHRPSRRGSTRDRGPVDRPRTRGAA